MMVTTSFTDQILQTRTRSLTGTVLLQTSHRARCCSHRWPRKLGRPRIHQGCWWSRILEMRIQSFLRKCPAMLLRSTKGSVPRMVSFGFNQSFKNIYKYLLKTFDSLHDFNFGIVLHHYILSSVTKTRSKQSNFHIPQ